MIRIEKITTRAQFSELRRAWDEVLAASGSDTVTLSHSWLNVWVNTVGRHRQLLVLRVRKRSETIGFVPLMFDTYRRRSNFSYQTLNFLSEPWGSIGDFVIARDRETVVPTVLNYLSSRLLCGDIQLTGIPDFSPNLELFRAYAADQSDRCEIGGCEDWFQIGVRGRSWEEYWRTTSKSFVRKDIARLKNRYAERSWRIREFGAEQLPEEMPTLTMLHECSQIRQGRESYFRDMEFQEFIEAALQDHTFSRWFRGFMLEIEGAPATFELGIQYGSTYHGWKTGFDPRFARLSPFKFLHYQILQSGFQEGWDVYEQGPGTEHYKRHWGPQKHKLYRFRMSNGWGVNAALKRWLQREPAELATAIG